MKINYNVPAARINTLLNMNDKNLARSSQKLSSGMKISVKDAPASYALAKKINSHIESTGVAKNNNGDAISVINVADGVLNEITDMIQRLNELSVKASNSTLSKDDRQIINDEAMSLTDEIQRLANSTQFNGQNILDGSFDYKGYVTVDNKTNPNFKMLYASDDVAAGNYEFKDGILYSGNKPYINGTATMDKDNVLTIKDNQGKEFRIQTDGEIKDFKIEYPKIGALNAQIGSMASESLEIRIPKVSLENMSLKNLDLVNKPDEGIERTDKALAFISSVRGKLGAYENRLEHTANSLEVKEESLTGAYSRIMDTDIAEEMTNYATQQILVQASMNMLSQANERPAQILQLLQ